MHLSGAPQFKSALKKAADNALAAGTIDTEQHSQITEVTNGPSVNRSNAAQSLAQAALGGLSGAIDWMNLISQLQTLIPFILQIIALFKKTPTVA